MQIKQPILNNSNYSALFVLIPLLGLGFAAMSGWLLDTFNLGLEVSGVTYYVFMYYIAGMVMSAALFLISKEVRKVGIFMAFYPFGVVAIFFTGFAGMLSNPPSDSTANGLAGFSDQLKVMQIVFVQAFVWGVPAVVTGYYFFKAYRASRN